MGNTSSNGRFQFARHVTWPEWSTLCYLYDDCYDCYIYIYIIYLVVVTPSSKQKPPNKKTFSTFALTFPQHFFGKGKDITVSPRYDHLKHILRIKSRFVLPFDCRCCEAYRNWADIDVTLAWGKVEKKTRGKNNVAKKKNGHPVELNIHAFRRKSKASGQLKKGRTKKKRGCWRTSPTGNMQVGWKEKLTVQVFKRFLLWKGPGFENWTTDSLPSIHLPLV